MTHASIEPTATNKVPLVLQDATVVDVRTGELIEDQTIIVTGNRISYIGDNDEVTLPKHAQVRNASGQYVIPGLWDMHVHLDHDHEHAFPLLLGNGVTGVRDMGAPLNDIDKWKNVIKKGMSAPRIIYAGSTIFQFKGNLEAPHVINVKSEKEAREAVRTNASKGADFLKVYSYKTPAIYAAIVDEAKKYRLPIAGHLPMPVRAIDAVRAGQKSIEHMYGLFIATSSKEAEFLGKADYEDRYYEYEILAEKHYDPKRAERLFNIFVQNEVYQVPMLITEKNELKSKIDSRAIYVPTAFQKAWIKMIKGAEPDKMTADYVKIKDGMVKKMNDAGVPILAGTDSDFELTNLIYGVSLHDELQLLVENGLSPLQALQTATLNPAKYMERVYELGTVEEGKLADLVLLKANPLEDIRNTTRISAVIYNGKLIEKKELEKSIKTYELVKMEDVKVEPSPPHKPKSSSHHHGLHSH
nr:amidohydrolase family protein [Paenibacillus arenosi]